MQFGCCVSIADIIWFLTAVDYSLFFMCERGGHTGCVCLRHKAFVALETQDILFWAPFPSLPLGNVLLS